MTDTTKPATEPAANPAPAAVEPGSNLTEYLTMNNGNSYSLDGPLSRAYSEALDELYAKDKDPNTRLSMETQEMDVAKQQRGWIAAKGAQIDMDGNIEDMGLLYGVSRGHLTQTTVIDVVDRFHRLSGHQRAKSALVLDAAYLNEADGTPVKIGEKVVNEGSGNAAARPAPQIAGNEVIQTEATPNDHSERIYGMALEQYAARHGIQVYSSLAAFLKAHV